MNFSFTLINKEPSDQLAYLTSVASRCVEVKVSFISNYFLLSLSTGALQSISSGILISFHFKNI